MKTWTKTRKQGVLRHRSGVYYARLYLGDKEKWFSLRTNILEVALSRFETNDEVVAVRERQVRGLPVSSKPLTFQQAKDLYLARLDGRVALDKMKPGTRAYWATVLSTVEASWKRIMKVDLAALDVGKIKTKDLEDWAKEYLQTPSVRESRKASGRKTISARYFNNSLFALRSVFSEAVKAGSLHRNPAENLETARVPSTKLCLPTRKQFRALVSAIRSGTHRTATAAADMVEFLAYSGCRVGEARRVKWGDANLRKKSISILGDPRTATKNWEIREIPIIPPMAALLKRMQSRRHSTDPLEPLLKVRDVRGALIRGCKAVNIALMHHHDLRHLFATVGVEREVDVPTIAQWLGHKDGGALAMKTYAHPRTEHSKNSATKMVF